MYHCCCCHCCCFGQWFCEGERLERLLKRSLAAADELAWKLLRNLATSGAQEVAGRMLVHARGLMALLQVCWRSRAFVVSIYHRVRVIISTVQLGMAVQCVAFSQPVAV
jgi:hypothetical protein